MQAHEYPSFTEAHAALMRWRDELLAADAELADHAVLLLRVGNRVLAMFGLRGELLAQLGHRSPDTAQFLRTPAQAGELAFRAVGEVRVRERSGALN